MTLLSSILHNFNLHHKLRRLRKSKFVCNVAIVATGTAGAQAVTMAFSPIITRLYGPEAFGLLGMFMALVALLYPISALAYPIAIVLPKEDNDAKDIARLSVYISLAMAVVFLLAILVGGDWLLALAGAKAIAAFDLLIPLNVLFVTWLQIAQKWLIRKKQFHVTAKVAVVQSLVVNSTKVGIGWFNPLAAVLIVLTTFGCALHTVMLYFGAKREGPSKDYTGQSQTRTPLFELAKRYYDFPLYRTPQIFLNAISQNLPVLMLAAFFGPSSAGFYAICRRVLSLPSELIAKSVGDVFYPRIAEAANKGENLTSLILKATLGLIAVGFLPFALVVVFGPWLFAFVFGVEWIQAGEYARWLALWLFFAFINRPSVAAIPVMNLQGYFLIYELLSVGLRLLALCIGFFMFKDDILAILLFSLAGIVLNVSLILLTLYRSKSYGIKIQAAL